MIEGDLHEICSKVKISRTSSKVKVSIRWLLMIQGGFASNVFHFTTSVSVFHFTTHDRMRICMKCLQQDSKPCGFSIHAYEHICMYSIRSYMYVIITNTCTYSTYTFLYTHKCTYSIHTYICNLYTHTYIGIRTYSAWNVFSRTTIPVVFSVSTITTSVSVFHFTTNSFVFHFITSVSVVYY